MPTSFRIRSKCNRRRPTKCGEQILESIVGCSGVGQTGFEEVGRVSNGGLSEPLLAIASGSRAGPEGAAHGATPRSAVPVSASAGTLKMLIEYQSFKICASLPFGNDRKE